MDTGLRLVRLLLVRDEADILPRNLAWYAHLGIPTVVVDNGSTDGSEEIVSEAVRDGTVLAWRRFDTPEHALARMLEAVLDLALRERPEAVVLTCADEFFEVADGTDLVQAITSDLEAGFTAITFANMEFHMTPRDDPLEPDPVRRLRYYSHRRTGMTRAWRPIDGMSLGAGMSHRPVFLPDVDLVPSPRKYVSRHYPLRSFEQARRKMSRIRPTRQSPYAHVHYLHYLGNESAMIMDPERLNRYDEDHAWDYEDRLRRWRSRETMSSLARLSVRHEELQKRYEALLAGVREFERGCDASASATSGQEP